MPEWFVWVVGMPAAILLMMWLKKKNPISLKKILFTGLLVGVFYKWLMKDRNRKYYK